MEDDDAERRTARGVVDPGHHHFERDDADHEGPEPQGEWPLFVLVGAGHEEQRQVPGAPDHAERHAGDQCAVPFLQPVEQVAVPAKFLGQRAEQQDHQQIDRNHAGLCHHVGRRLGIGRSLAAGQKIDQRRRAHQQRHRRDDNRQPGRRNAPNVDEAQPVVAPARRIAGQEREQDAADGRAEKAEQGQQKAFGTGGAVGQGDGGEPEAPGPGEDEGGERRGMRQQAAGGVLCFCHLRLLRRPVRCRQERW